MNGNRNFETRAPPVKVGEELDVKIEAVGEKGDGIAKKNGFVLFVPNVQNGDEVRIRVTKVLRKVGFAEVIGKAQGPVGGSSPRPRPEVTREDAKEIAGDEDLESGEDSEDFGEDEEPEK